MKKSVLLLACLILAMTLTKAQNYDFYSSDITVFDNNVNVRNLPSIHAKVIGKLNQNTVVQDMNNGCRGKYDTINGIPGWWLSIKYKDTVGYIFNEVINYDFNSFRSYINIDNTILVKSSLTHKLYFKVFNKGQLIYSANFDVKEKEPWCSAKSIGKTYYSNGKEVLVITFADTSYHLFVWDNHSIRELKAKPEILSRLNYYPWQDTFISKNNVNLRAEPNQESTVIANLHLYDKVKIVKEKVAYETINKIFGYWYQVEWQDKTGYIWMNVSIPIRYIKSNYQENLSFLYTSSAIYALENGKIIDRFDALANYWGKDFYEKGSMGFNDSFLFISIKVTGNTEGMAYGDVIYLWKNRKLTYLGSNIEYPDIEINNGDFLIFPTDKNGISNRVIARSDELLGLHYPQNYPPCQEDFITVVRNTAYKEMKFSGDKLVEVPSSQSRLIEFIKKAYPTYDMNQYTLGDINQDGLDDAVTILAKKIKLNEYNNPPEEVIVSVLLGKRGGVFEIFKTNKAIVGNVFTGVIIEIDKNNLTITVIYDNKWSPYSLENVPNVTIFTFTYNLADKLIYWKSFVEAYGKYNDDEDDHYTLYSDLSTWDVKKSSFKTRKILFENAWNMEANPPVLVKQY